MLRALFIDDSVCLTADFRRGLLTTDSGSDIVALQWIGGTVGIVYTPHYGPAVLYKSVKEGFEALRIPYVHFAPAFNCHGLTFGRSGYWIDDDQVDAILEQEAYVQVDQRDAQIVVFRSAGLVVHSARVFGQLLKNKAGVCATEFLREVRCAPRALKFDSYAFYKRRPLNL